MCGSELLLEKGGMYDRSKDLFLKYLKDLAYIASMGKAGGGRNDVSTGVGRKRSRGNVL